MRGKERRRRRGKVREEGKEARIVLFLFCISLGKSGVKSEEKGGNDKRKKRRKRLIKDMEA